MVIDGEYDHIGATIADAILQANRRYNLVVRPRVERILNNYAETQTTSAVVDLLRHVTISEFLDYRSERRTQRFSDVLQLFIKEGVETAADLRRWLTHPDSATKLRAIKGIGPKTADYFKILSGLPAIAIDRRLGKFLDVAAISYRNYNDAQDVLNLASDLLGYDRARFDHSIWQYMEAYGDRDQDSSPCCG